MKFLSKQPCSQQGLDIPAAGNCKVRHYLFFYSPCGQKCIDFTCKKEKKNKTKQKKEKKTKQDKTKKNRFVSLAFIIFALPVRVMPNQEIKSNILSMVIKDKMAEGYPRRLWVSTPP